MINIGEHYKWKSMKEEGTEVKEIQSERIVTETF